MADDTRVRTSGSVIHWAGAYDALTGLLCGGSSRLKVIDHAEIMPGESVLDVGCGPGRLTLLAKSRAGEGEVHGIDPSAEMIALAREKAAAAGLDVRYQEAAIEDLPFPDAHFDVVTSSYMLHHLPDEVKRRGFAEIARVLRPGGRLLAVDMTGKGILRQFLALVGHRFPDDYGGHIADLMHSAGLQPEVIPSERSQVIIRARKRAG